MTNEASERTARKLTTTDVEPQIDPERFGFSTTDELEPLDRIVGQPRATTALDLGLGVRHHSYNIYVAGLSGMGKMGMIRSALARRVSGEPAPPDWVYVHDFDRPDRPQAISLETGQARRLERDAEELVEQLVKDLPAAFEQEDLSRERQRISQRFQEKAHGVSRELEELAKERGMAIQQLPTGQVALVPIKDDRPMTSEEIEQLTDEEREDVQRRQADVTDRATSLLSRQQELRRELGAELKKLERRFAARHIGPLVEEIAGRYQNEKVRDWLRRMRESMIDNVDAFVDGDSEKQQEAARLVGTPVPDSKRRLRRYRVNVLVDNSRTKGAPVIIENAPNYKNLFGLIDRPVDPRGHGTADFMDIKAGSLLRANGGYVVFDLVEALVEPVVWKELKRAIKSGSLEIQAYEPLGMLSISALKPEPIPLRVKLVVIGSPRIYHMLHLLDDDFREIFKVKAEFSRQMDRDTDDGAVVGRLVRKMAREEPHGRAFDAAGVAELVRAGARLAEDRDKLTGEFSRLADVAREASYWAGEEDRETVGRRHVRRAIEQKVYRSDLIAERIRELIANRALRVSVEGTEIAQVNGLAVVNLGDHAFGRPTRVTASVGTGSGGIVNIERESNLSGGSYDKGVLILEGYLRNRYAAGRPLALSASLAMEQNYGLIDGDSASVTELLCLLSGIAGIPLRQDIAVTGSVNQHGSVQAVGGVNEKIEGFFDVCRENGLTGEQGVAIPDANVRNLVLRPDVVEAIGEGRFHVWALRHVDQGLELLSGLTAGDPEQVESFHGRVGERLGELAAALQKHRAPSAERTPVFQPPPQQPSDPRPPLPVGHHRDAGSEDEDRG